MTLYGPVYSKMRFVDIEEGFLLQGCKGLLITTETDLAVFIFSLQYFSKH